MDFDLKKLLAFGSGVGIQIAGPRGAESLEIAAGRVRPNCAQLLGRLTIRDFSRQPAAVWGSDYSAFLRKYDVRHVPAAVILPRHEVIVRQLSLPGVSNKDLDAAVQFQLEGLHPYGDNDIVASWSRLGGTSTILIAIARRAAIERYTSLFAEAGIRLGSFTCSAAAIYSALRFTQAPRGDLLLFEAMGEYVEYYGESAARPLFSATFPDSESRAAALAAAELRIDPSTQVKTLEEVLSAAPALPYAAALTSACPRLSLPLNLLPAELRQASSRANWVPLAIAGSMVVVSAAALFAVPAIENRRYESTLQNEIRVVERQANRAAALDRETAAVRARTLLLDDFHRQTKADLDILAEMTRLLPNTVWLNQLDVMRGQVTIAGQADQAAPLLKLIDASPWFEGSEFIGPPVRAQDAEAFRIRTNREGGR
ncbi:MAG TPA: PilN domain-containing protein [Bryobacteraceae bacterium]|jgi:Tfp pilus assembly protein PilN|nr:PilN domain-containing protein [Bryobacteraceae bacterium]